MSEAEFKTFCEALRQAATEATALAFLEYLGDTAQMTWDPDDELRPTQQLRASIVLGDGYQEQSFDPIQFCVELAARIGVPSSQLAIELIGGALGGILPGLG